MKKLNFILVAFLFIISCEKDKISQIRETSKSESSTVRSTEFNFPCLNNGQPRILPNPEFSLAYEALKNEVKTSPSFNWSSEFNEIYGEPAINVSLYSETLNSKTLHIPIFSTINNKVTAMTSVTKKDNRLSYIFYDRYDAEQANFTSPNSVTRVLVHNFKILDYTTCVTNTLPDAFEPFMGSENGTWIYRLRCYEIDPGIPVPSDDNCPCYYQVPHLNEVPCPPSGPGGPGGSPGGSGDGPGTNGGPGGNTGNNGTGANNGSNPPGSNSNVSEALIQAMIKEALINICNISEDDCLNAIILKEEICNLHLIKLNSYLKGYNFSPLSKCIVSKNLAENAQSAPTCSNLNLPNISNISSYVNANLAASVYVYPQLTDVICGLMHSNMLPIVRMNLSNAINDYLSPILNNPNAPSGNGGNGTASIPVGMLANIATITNLISTHFPSSESQNIFNQEMLTWLLNNSTELDKIHSHISSFQANSGVAQMESNYQIAKSVSLTYASIVKETGINTLHLDSANPTSPIYGIMKEMLLEAIKEQLIDLIPGATLTTLGPEVFANFQDGNWISGMQNAFQIVMNEADVFFPAWKVMSCAVGMAVSAKQLKKVFDAFDKAKSLGSEYIQKLYNVFRNKLNLGIGEIRQKFRWLDDNKGAELDDIPAQTLFNKLKEEFGVTIPVFMNTNQNNDTPVFKILEIPNSNSSIYMELYTNSSTGYPLTIGFYTGPHNATIFSQLNPKFKIRFQQ